MCLIFRKPSIIVHLVCGFSHDPPPQTSAIEILSNVEEHLKAQKD